MNVCPARTAFRQLRLCLRPAMAALPALLLLGVAACAPPASAQSSANMTRALGISVFGGYTYSKPDYSEQANNGGTFGVDVTRYLGRRYEPSLELRGDVTHGPIVDEKAILVGGRIAAPFRERFHPYADVLVGAGYLTFHFPPSPGYTSDSGFAYALGGGLDYDIFRHIAVTGDFSYQHVNFSDQDDPNFHLTPLNVTIGLHYDISFSPHIHHRDYR